MAMYSGGKAGLLYWARPCAEDHIACSGRYGYRIALWSLFVRFFCYVIVYVILQGSTVFFDCGFCL